MKPKVGHIQFLNCLPLYYGLVKSEALLDLEMIKGTPTELNELLINGKLDISPISSIEYARHHESLVLFPEFTVSSDGEVKSILLMSRSPIENLSGKKVALTTTSATSQVLVKLVLSRGYNIEPEYTACAPDLGNMLADAEAALLIGDIALRHYLDRQGLYLYDLGAEWKRMTGKKMVYAVWAVSRRFAESQHALNEHVFELFKKSMDYSMAHLSEIAEYAARWEPFSPFFLMDYFRSLRFTFDREYQEGLLHFYKLAEEIGAIAKVPELEFISVNTGVKI